MVAFRRVIDWLLVWLLVMLALILVALVAPRAAADHAPHARRPVPGAVIRGFDPPSSPYGPGHRGVDLAAEAGDVVRAALAGTVSYSGVVAGTGYVTIDHGAGLATTYGDLAPRTVAAGRRVAAGTVLGSLAEAATHLDWGARLGGAYIDPLTLLAHYEVRLVRLRD